jgi:hypothetical protein
MMHALQNIMAHYAYVTDRPVMCMRVSFQPTRNIYK